MLTIKTLPVVAYEIVQIYEGDNEPIWDVRAVTVLKVTAPGRCEGLDSRGWPFRAGLDCFFATKAEAEAAAAKDMEAKV